jgi:hypothetical protein
LELDEQAHNVSVATQGENQTNPEVPRSTAATELPAKAVVVDLQAVPRQRYTDTYTTGPFSLPLNTHSIDWGILNNDPAIQKVRVTVFKCVTGTIKTAEPPGPLVVTLDPGETTHNANAASAGFFYEIQVECNSRLIFPYASAWSGAIANPIPGSVVKSAEFVRKLP